jgi:hypothetical protein
MALAMILLGFTAEVARALEIITEEDVAQAIVTEVNLAKAGDNAIILFDSSGSMAKPLEGTSLSRLETLKELLSTRLAWLPDLGYNFGIEPSRMVVMGYGDLNPVASNETPEGRRLNRRAEIAVGLD